MRSSKEKLELKEGNEKTSRVNTEIVDFAWGNNGKFNLFSNAHASQTMRNIEKLIKVLDDRI